MSGSLPKAYREGCVDFYGRKFKVTPNVLIPRPETEMIIDSVLSLSGKAYLPGVKASKAEVDCDNLTIVDVGTGSGCIAATLQLELPGAKVFAVDISEKALDVAKENAEILGADVTFSRSDLLSGVASDNVNGDLIIVANLPYVDREWEWLDREALSFEPEEALYAEDGGLALYKRLFREAGGISSGKVFVVIEADPCQHEELIKCAGDLGFRHIETRGFALVFTC